MADGPAALAKIDRLSAAARIAHELLADATRIVTVDMPAAATALRRLVALWIEQDLLDPAAAAAAAATGRTLQLQLEVERSDPCWRTCGRGSMSWRRSSGGGSPIPTADQRLAARTFAACS